MATLGKPAQRRILHTPSRGILPPSISASSDLGSPGILMSRCRTATKSGPEPRWTLPAVRLGGRAGLLWTSTERCWDTGTRQAPPKARHARAHAPHLGPAGEG